MISAFGVEHDSEISKKIGVLRALNKKPKMPSPKLSSSAEPWERLGGQGAAARANDPLRNSVTPRRALRQGQAGAQPTRRSAGTTRRSLGPTNTQRKQNWML